MIIESTPLSDVMRVELERHEDQRGYFARIYCGREFARHGLRTPMVQDSLSFNRQRGTLRGLHFHAAGFPQVRLIRCVSGAAKVVVLDLRADSPTCLEHLSFDVSATNGRAIYTPPGVALGYQTLLDETSLLYQMPEYYDPVYERGARWNDPAFGIEWPLDTPILNERDATYPDFDHSALHGTDTGS